MNAEDVIADVICAIDSAVAKLKEGELLTFINVDDEEVFFSRYELASPTRLCLFYGYGNLADEYSTALSPDDGDIVIDEKAISGMDEDGEPFTLYLQP